MTTFIKTLLFPGALIKVFEGENFDNALLGTFTLRGIPSMHRIKVSYEGRSTRLPKLRKRFLSQTTRDGFPKQRLSK